MMTSSHDLLANVKPETEDILLKVLENDFWLFQYTSRKFLRDLKKSLATPDLLLKTRDIPDFKKIVKEQQDFFICNTLTDEDKLELTSQVEGQLKYLGGWPDSAVKAFRDAVLTGVDTSNRKIIENEQCTSDPLLMFWRTFKTISLRFDLPDYIFEKLLTFEVSEDEWNSQSLKDICQEMKRRHDFAQIYDDARLMRQLSLNGVPLEYDLYIELEDVAVNEIILKTSNLYEGFYLTDLFRGLKMSCMMQMFTPFSVDTYTNKLKSLLRSGSLWQPIYEKDAMCLLAMRAITIDVPNFMEYYANIPAYFEYIKPLADLYLIKGLDNKDNVFIVISVANTTDFIPFIQSGKIFNEIKSKIDFEIKRMKTKSLKSVKVKNKTVLYDAYGIRVGCLSSNDISYDISKDRIIVVLNIAHKDFALKSAIDRVRNLYYSSMYLFGQGKKKDFKVDMSLTPDFRFGQISRFLGLLIWDKIDAGQTLSEAINEILEIRLENCLLDDACENKFFDSRHLYTIFDITCNCIETCQMLPMNIKYVKKQMHSEARFSMFDDLK